MSNWRDKLRPVSELLDALSPDEKRIIMHALAHVILEGEKSYRAVSIGEYSGTPVGILFVRGAGMVNELELYSEAMGFVRARETEELPKDEK